MEWLDFPSDLRLTTADLDGHLARYGQDTVVRRSTICPCIDPETGRARPGHVLCSGWGVLYPPALEIAALKVEWKGNSLTKKQQESGFVETGDYTATWPSTQPLGAADLFVHPVEESVTIDELIKGHLDPQAGSLERLRYRYVTLIEYVRSLDAVYEQGVDFDLDVDGRTVLWLDAPGIAPEEGQVYTVRYRNRAEYAISGGMPQVRHDGPNKLPWKARLVRYDPLARQAGQNLTEGAT